MTHDLRRVRELFEEAVEVTSPADRVAYLDGACGGDPSLRREVEALLAAQTGAEDFLQPGEVRTAMFSRASAGAQPAGPVAPLEGFGNQIGHYRLLERIGEGGFGVVYRAEQTEPLRREVALKILKVGVVSREVMGRFELERQALALMDHPGIARVFDAGATSGGAPYFVMELVPGRSLTGFCDEEQLTVEERIRLFIQVCRSIEHAHQRGVLHRDLKPSNVLVTWRDGVPAAKVIDFGIAKAIRQPLTGVAVTTQMGLLLGTPAYMSPEQAEPGFREADTRADIYSLGALLYELLTGRPPLDFPEQGNAADLLRAIAVGIPQRPSVRLEASGPALAEIAERRDVPPQRLKRMLRGDLDWIVMRAIEKDRERRYGTVHALVRDLECFLEGKPVEAGPPGWSYRARKFVGRHRGAVAATGVTVLALFLGFCVASTGFIHAARERDRAVASEMRERRLGYVSDMNLAWQALERHDLALSFRLLSQHRAGGAGAAAWEWRYLWEQCRGDAWVTLARYSNAVCSVSCAPDGRSVAVGVADGTLQVWDMPGRKLVSTPQTHGPSCIARFAPTGGTFAATDEAGRVRLWRGSRVLGVFPEIGGRALIRAVAFSADGSTIAAGAADGRVWLWSPPDPRTRNPLSSGIPAGLQAGALVVAERGAWVAAGGGDGRIRISSPSSPAVEREWQAHRESVTALALSPDERWLVSGAGPRDGSVRLWSVDRGEMVARFDEHTAWVRALAFSPDGTLLASASADETIRLWDLHNLEQRRPVSVLRGHPNHVLSLAFTPDGRTLVSGAEDGRVQLWRVRTGDNARPDGFLTSSCRTAEFGANSSEILGLDATGNLVRWSDTNHQSQESIPIRGSNYALMAVSPSGTWAAFHSPTAGLEIRRLPGLEFATNLAPLPSGEDVTALRFTPDGRRLVAVVGHCAVRIWATDTWAPAASWATRDDLIPFLEISASGEMLAGGGGRIRVWRLETGELIRRLDPGIAGAGALAFSPEGSWLASAGSDGTILLWRTGDWQPGPSFRGRLGAINALAFSPDGGRLVSGGADREAIQFWDLETRRQVFALSLPGESIAGLRFSPDGNVLLAVTADSSARFWRAP
jgi:WD40 repeat protein/serine/threonine protein kinase